MTFGLTVPRSTTELLGIPTYSNNVQNIQKKNYLNLY